MDPITVFFQTHPWAGVLLGAVFGSGGLWSLLQHLNARRVLQLNASKVIADLQKELADKLVRLMELSKQYADLRVAEAASGPTREHQDRGNEMRRLMAHIDLLKTEIPDVESRLARLEGRPEREIQVQWIRPSAPTGLRIIQE